MKRLVILFIFIAGCRSVTPVRELQTSLDPDISRVMLKDGKVVVFNGDFGWYNKQAGTIEGVTADSQHVEYHLAEVNKVETVRAYSIIPLVFTIGAVLGFGIFLLAKLLTFV